MKIAVQENHLGVKFCTELWTYLKKAPGLIYIFTFISKFIFCKNLYFFCKIFWVTFYLKKNIKKSSIYFWRVYLYTANCQHEVD